MIRHSMMYLSLMTVPCMVNDQLTAIFVADFMMLHGYGGFTVTLLTVPINISQDRIVKKS